MNESTHKLVIESQLDAIPRARHWITQLARDAGFDAESVFAVELAVGEALVNIVEHAYEGKEGQEIHIFLAVDDTKLTLTIRDFGRKFDTTTYTPPNLNEPSDEGGYGVYLIRKVMDEVTYDTSLPQGTKVDLVKYRLEANRG